MICSSTQVVTLLQAVRLGDPQAATQLGQCYAPELAQGAWRADPSDPSVILEVWDRLLEALLMRPSGILSFGESFLQRSSDLLDRENDIDWIPHSGNPAEEER